MKDTTKPEEPHWPKRSRTQIYIYIYIYMHAFKQRSQTIYAKIELLELQRSHIYIPYIYAKVQEQTEPTEDADSHRSNRGTSRAIRKQKEPSEE